MSKTWDEAVTTWENTDGADDMKATNMAEVLFGCIEAVRAESQTLRFELNTALLRIKALEESVEDLLHGEAGDTDVAVRSEEPEIRVRISHAHTLKDGWRCDSTTVEWTGRGEPDWDAMEDRLKRTHLLGIAEAAMRNQDDGVAAAARDNVKALAS